MVLLEKQQGSRSTPVLGYFNSETGYGFVSFDTFYTTRQNVANCRSSEADRNDVARCRCTPNVLCRCWFNGTHHDLYELYDFFVLCIICMISILCESSTICMLCMICMMCMVCMVFMVIMICMICMSCLLCMSCMLCTMYPMRSASRGNG